MKKRHMLKPESVIRASIDSSTEIIRGLGGLTWRYCSYCKDDFSAERIRLEWLVHVAYERTSRI